MNETYANLRNKTHYSCGLAVGTAKQSIQNAKKKGLYGIAITDKNTMSGVLDFYNTGKDEKFPVALGMETSLSDNYGNLHDLILLCKSQKGYTNLCHLATASERNKDGSRQYVMLADIHESNEDLVAICTTKEAYDIINSIFEDVYVEISPYVSRIESILPIVTSVPSDRVIISSDSYMCNPEDKVLQDIMVTNSKFGEVELHEETKFCMSYKELCSAWYNFGFEQVDLDLFCRNSILCFDKCKNIELKFKDQIVSYPHLLHPENKEGLSKEELLLKLVYKSGRMKDDEVYKDRLNLELDAVLHNSRVNLVDYFLVLEDICRFCRDNDIPVGPGRGSGAGSLILYCLQVTNLNPIDYGLMFERFISKGRIEKGSLPDVDLDFAEPQKVRDYLIEMYGENRVVQIGTMQTLQAKGAMTDAFKFLYPDVDFATIKRISKKFPKKDQEESEAEYFQRAIDESEFVGEQLTIKYPKIADAVVKLLGFNRQAGIHPCGLAISQDPIEDFMPLRNVKGKWVLQYDAESCEQSGIIKYDILGLKTLKFFQKAVNQIKDRYPNSPIKSIYDIPLDDEKTYQAFMNKDTESVFQFNSDTARKILGRLNEISNLDTLSMVTSVGRPGPMRNDQHTEFIHRKNGTKASQPPHPSMLEYLKETYGIMIYQESVMKCAQVMGGFTLAEADDIRKAMGKKKIEILKPYKDKFVANCKQQFPETADVINGKDITYAEYLWNLMETFSGYGFNKSHSMCYTLIGYFCQYLKTHYPLEWWAACMSAADGDPDHLKRYYSGGAKDHFIHPNVNFSKDEYYVYYHPDKEGGLIIAPFSALKGVGDKATEAIIKGQPYSSFEDFFERVEKRKVNKKIVLSLIFCGAFVSLTNESPIELVKKYFSLRKEKKIPEKYLNMSSDDLAKEAANALDYYEMDYILTYKDLLSTDEQSYINEIIDLPHDKPVSVFGEIGKITTHPYRKDPSKAQMRCSIKNGSQEIELFFFDEGRLEFEKKILPGRLYLVKGTMKKDWGDKTQILVNNVLNIDQLKYRRENFGIA